MSTSQYYICHFVTWRFVTELPVSFCRGHILISWNILTWCRVHGLKILVQDCLLVTSVTRLFSQNCSITQKSYFIATKVCQKRLGQERHWWELGTQTLPLGTVSLQLSLDALLSYYHGLQYTCCINIFSTWDVVLSLLQAALNFLSFGRERRTGH